MSIAIIGGGIGGLTTAIALQKKGIKVIVFEQAEYLKPVGAGIILANNAMQVYNKLGLREIIEKNGNVISSVNITRANLKPLSKVDLSFFERQFGVKNIAIHRGVLQQLLIDNLDKNSFHLNYELEKITKTAYGYSLAFENGEIVQANTVIGADGIHSKVREQLFVSGTIRNANQICWRGVSSYSLPQEYKNELNEAWGETERFGFVQIASNKVYWYALQSFIKVKEEYSLKEIERYFKEYHTVVQDLIAGTTKNQIHSAEIIDLEPIDIWYKENVCLLGDAAHAMTPNMGQGACQAIEDAYILSECLFKYNTDEAFKKFQNLRLPKAQRIVNTSWRIGKMAHMSNVVLRGIRNWCIKKIPSTINKKQMLPLFKIPSV